VTRLSQSRIFVVDNLVTPCTLNTVGQSDVAESLGALKDAEMYEPIAAPPYVPKNFGQAGKFPLQLSVYMTSGLNGVYSYFLVHESLQGS
jgi:hypothetical protein